MMPYPVISDIKANGKIEFNISKEISKNIVSNPLWRRIISEIELNLRKLAASYSSQIIFDMNVRKDVELPSWQKTILSINVPEMDFKRKMILWEIIDSKVRKTIEKRSEQLNEAERKRVELINRNLFTKMVLN